MDAKDSGDTEKFEVAVGDGARRQRRLDDKLSTCPETGSRAPSSGRQSVERPGEVREQVLE